MKLFSKIKDILFDDEELDEPIAEKEVEHVEDKVEDKKEVIEETPKVEEKKFDFGDDFDIPKRKEEPAVEERDIFKAANTFNFPLEVDEVDFVPIEMPKRNQNALNFEKETKRVEVEKYTIKKTETVEVRDKPFKASPVISPIYGVMDKNYKKEDIVVKQKVEITKTQQKNMDLDMARKKAYGTLEDEIEITLERPYDVFYKQEKEIEEIEEELPAKSIDNLLLDASEIEDKGEELLHETFKLDEVIKEMKKSAKDLDDTNEDLFNLIDSMYEDKED